MRWRHLWRPAKFGLKLSKLKNLLFGGVSSKCKNCDTHDCCISFATQELPRSLSIFLFYAQGLQKLMCKKCPNVAKKVSFFQISWKIAFWKNVNSAKILQWLCLLHIARSLENSSHSDHICRSMVSKSPKMDKNVLKLDILILLHRESLFLLTIRKASYQDSFG